MKKLIQIEILRKEFDKRPTWNDIKKLNDIEFEDDDIFTLFEEDGVWIFSVERIREETDEEYQNRLKRTELVVDHVKKLRYEQYLKLKEEFKDSE